MVSPTALTKKVEFTNASSKFGQNEETKTLQKDTNNDLINYNSKAL